MSLSSDSHLVLSLSSNSKSIMLIEPVSLTPKAIEEVKNIMANKNIPEGYGLE